jgi:glycosyltransferase involved in cell wall biosynthesis
MNIAHLTSVHGRFDVRIFIKMCMSLANNGHRVTLIVADGKHDEIRDGVEIFDVGASKSRLDRIKNSPKRILERALLLDADLYHLHDPELIPIGLKLKRLGKRVVFDSHEDVPSQLLGKPYLNKPALWSLSKAYGLFERWACRQLDGVITATPFIRDKFLSVNQRTLDINNFPNIGEYDAAQVPWSKKANEVCYVGGISQGRGIRELIEAMGLVRSGVRLNLCGNFSGPWLVEKCKSIPGWHACNIYGYLDRPAVNNVLRKSVAGLVTFRPMPNHIFSQPNKLFEYMAAGIPVIASNFPLWKDIVLGYRCGLCVDPMDPIAIAIAIDYLSQHPEEAFQMGQNGRNAVAQYFNWSLEESKLIAFYKIILGVK